jgi:23S rRNA pseudouridine1911/1915/1917 synthase
VKLLEDGDITTGGKAMPKSDRVAAGQIIEVLMPEPINSDPIPLTPLEGLSIVYDDSDIVVIDKPVGCAAHPSPGWTGPTVIVPCLPLVTPFQLLDQPNARELFTD